MTIPAAVTIRAATREDIPRVLELITAGALDAPGADRAPAYSEDLASAVEAFDAIAARDDQAIIVAELDQRVVGTLQFVVIRHLHRCGGRCAEVEAVHVDAAMRGRGIGGVLMRWAVDEARRRGCYRVQLTSNVARVEAHRFYERLGFAASHKGFKLLL